MVWSKRFGGSGKDRGLSVAVNGSGDVIVTGYFEGIADFGGGPLSSAGDCDIFVAYFDATGAHRWSKRFGSTGEDWGTAVAVDSSGAVTVAGYFKGTADVGGGPVTSAGDKDLFVASFTSMGAHRWSRRVGGAGQDFPQGLAVDPGGNVTVTGWFEGSVDFGGGALSTDGALADIFVASYDHATGAHRWSKRLGGGGEEWGFAVAADANGNVSITGRFNDPMDLGGGTLTSAGLWDVFLASYGPTGAHRWSKRFGGTGGDWSGGLTADGSGNVTVTGNLEGTVDFGGGPLTSAGLGDIFIASYGPTGAYRWARRFGDVAVDYGRGVAADASGNVIVTGACEGTIDLGGGLLSSLGARDIFVASYDPTGAHRWSKRFGGPGAGDWGFGVALGTGGQVALTGQFEGTADFGTGSLTSAGDVDAFLVYLAP